MQMVTPSFREIKLSQEELEEIEKLSACGYMPEQIAIYLDVDVSEFVRMFNIPESMVRMHYKKGVLESEYLIGQKLLENAKTGNITAADAFEERQNRVRLDNLKSRIFNDGH